MEQKHEVVISGISGVFPESEDVEELRSNLFNKVDMVTTESSRWTPGELGVPTRIGKIKNSSRDFFDYQLFGVNFRLAAIMDPSTKMVVEQAFRAVCDSGTSFRDLVGTNTAVYMASVTSETEDLFMTEEEQGTYGLVAHSRAFQANRVSYVFNFKGPSMVIDSSWGGGMEALQKGYDAVATGQSTAAVIGATSLIFSPHFSYHFQAMGRLSEDGKTRCFSSDANGYARSEGAVVLFLQRAEHARRSYGSILGIHSEMYGFKNEPFTEFSPECYEQTLKKAYEKSGIEPKDVDYFEANGSASTLVDAEELNVAAGVFLPGRQKPLLVGCIKSNLGHTEAASSLVSVVKALIALDCGVIPPNLYYSSPNLKVPALVSGRIQVVTEPTKIEGDIVCVSSMGVSGPYSHVVLKRNPKAKASLPTPGTLPADGLPRLVLLTGRIPENIEMNRERLAQGSIDVEFVDLLNNLARDGIRNYLYRGYSVINGVPNNYSHIDAYSSGMGRRPVWFVFTGMGSQWPGMGKSLMKLPIFANAILICHQTLRQRNIDLLDIITSEDPQIFENILNAFIGIAAVQIGLVDVLKSVGVEPDGIVGHSLGEQGCGYADGCLSPEQTILSAYARGKASLNSTHIKGMMAAVGMGYQNLKNQLPPNVEIGCHNSKESCTLSGPAEDVEKFIGELKTRGIFAKLVNVGDIAFHSKHIKPAGDLLVKYLKGVIPEPKKRSLRWVSSSIPETRWNEDLAQYCSAEYHSNNMLSPVLFEEACAHIPSNAIVIEIAPHALLQGILKKSIPGGNHVPLTSKFEKDGLGILLNALGKLYVAGIPIQVDKLYPKVVYPVSRGTPFLSPYIGWNHKEEFKFVRAKTDIIACYKELEINLRDEDFVRLTKHKVNGKVVIPASFYLEQVIDLYTEYKKSPGSPVIIENLSLESGCEASYHSNIELDIKVLNGTGEFSIIENQSMKIVCKGRISLSNTRGFDSKSFAVTLSREQDFIDGEHFSSLLKYKGIDLIEDFSLVRKAYPCQYGIEAVIYWNGKWMEFLNSIFAIVGFYEGRSFGDIWQLKSAKEMILDPSALFRKPAQEIMVAYNACTRIVQCHGVRIILPEMRAPGAELLKENVQFSCELLHFTPYFNPEVDSDLQIMELCAQLVLENRDLKDTGVVKLIVIGAQFEKELTEIVQFPKYSDHFELTLFDSEQSLLECVSTHHSDVVWVVSSIKLLSSTISTVRSPMSTFLLVPQYENGASPAVKISEFSSKGNHFVLKSLKPTNSGFQYEVVHYKQGNEALQQKLSDAKMLNAKEDTDRHIVVLTSIVDSVATAVEIIDDTINSYNHPLLRYVFTEHDEIDSKALNNQIQMNLKINVRMGDKWGSLRSLPVCQEEVLVDDEYSGDQVYPLYLVATVDEALAVGLNLSDVTGSIDKDSIRVFDYSTRTKIGIATYDPVLKTFSKDKIFEWTRPDSWSDIEASSIPVLYSLAAYIVYIVNNPSPGSSILINQGLIPISRALISLALGAKLEVYATVYGEQEKKRLLKIFPALKEENIFDCGQTAFHTSVLQRTQGRGVYKVVNTFADDLMIESCVKSTSVRGTYVQVSTAPMLQNSKMGMLFFDDEVIAAGATVDIVLSLPVKVKQRLRDILKQEMINGHIKPFSDALLLPASIDNFDAARFLRTASTKVVVGLKSLQKKKLDTKVYVCETEMNYVIVGGRSQKEFWLKLTEWLLRRGARRINVFLQQPTLSRVLASRLQTLNSCYPNSTIYLYSARNFDSKPSIEHAINDLTITGQIGGVFLLSTAVREKSALVDQVLQEKQMSCDIICLGNGGEKLCARRKNQGLMSLNIRCSPTIFESPSFLQQLDGFIINSCKHPVVTVSRYANQGQLRNRSGVEWSHIPESSIELEELFTISSQTATFIEIPSNTSRQAGTREIDPVYVIPGLKISHLNSIAQRLHFPVFVANLPLGKDLEAMAEDLVREMIKTRQFLFTIIADEWGGLLAILVASKLQALDKLSTIIMLDAAPSTTQHWSNELLADDVALITRYMKLNPKVISRMAVSPTWEDKMRLVLDSRTDTEEAQRCVKGLTLLRDRLQGLVSSKGPEQKIKTLCHLFRYGNALRSDQCCLKEYLERKAVVHLIDAPTASNMIEAAMDEVNSLVLFEYRDAANQPKLDKVGIGFLSDVHVPPPSLTVVHKVVS